MSEPQNQDETLGTGEATLEAKAAVDEKYTSEQPRPDEKIGAGQSPPGAESAAKGDYKVGRGRPPKEYQWSKGQSGNPAGRPRKKRGNKEVLEKIRNERITLRENGKERKVTKYEAIWRNQYANALKGNQRSAKLIMEEEVRLGVGQEVESGFPAWLPPKRQWAQSDELFNVDMERLSDEEKAELARIGEIMDLGGGFTALNVADFVRSKQISDKGRGKDVTPPRDIARDQSL